MSQTPQEQLYCLTLQDTGTRLLRIQAASASFELKAINISRQHPPTRQRPKFQLYRAHPLNFKVLRSAAPFVRLLGLAAVVMSCSCTPTTLKTSLHMLAGI